MDTFLTSLSSEVFKVHHMPRVTEKLQDRVPGLALGDQSHHFAVIGHCLGVISVQRGSWAGRQVTR